MAECKQTAQEFIQSTFCPKVAVLCSSDAEYLCLKNNLSFVQLIQPFCRLTTEAHIRDPHNASHTIRGLRVCVREMNYLPPQESHARKLISDTVNATGQNVENSTRGNVITVGDYDLQISTSTPWFEAFREMFLRLIPPTDHDFLSHCLACMIVVSSSHADPMGLFNSLSQHQSTSQHQTPNKPPKWFCPNTLKYYVLLHDVVESDLARAEAMYQSMKTTFSNHVCHLLQINSRSPQSIENMRHDGATNIPDPWSQFLTYPQLDPQKKTLGGQKVILTVENTEPDRVTPDDSVFPSGQMTGQTVGQMAGERSLTKSDTVDSAYEATEDQLNSPNQNIMEHPLAVVDSSARTTDDGSGSASSAVNHRVSVTPVERSISIGHGACLTTSDHDRLRIFIHEFVVRALIPWAEKQMRIFSEQVQDWLHQLNVKAKVEYNISRLQVLAKRLWRYSSEAPELQLRRLADLAFLFQIYEYAYHNYNLAKRDFNNDHAWLYYAGALEMCCVSVFMQDSQQTYPNHYMESVITTYLTTCSNPHYASRATLLSTECLKSRGLFTDAALQFIKLTSEQSDLRSALLLEQAAHCYIRISPAMVRKYAFHMILAGHRFSKAGQRRHALRSYSQAFQVYKGKDWLLAEDHINFTIGRQLFNLRLLANSVTTFGHLLTDSSKQSAAQQGAFIREYLFVYAQLLAQDPGEFATVLPELPVPFINSNNTRVCLVENIKNDKNGVWNDLEYKVIKKSVPSATEATFEPTILCYDKSSKNTKSPHIHVNETVTIEIELHNPFGITMVMNDVTLLWCFTPTAALIHANGTPQLITNEVTKSVKNKFADEIVTTEVIPEIQLQSYETRQVTLSLTPQQTGQLRVADLAYNLSAGVTADSIKPNYAKTLTVRGKQKLEVQGPRLNNTKEEWTSKIYAPDRRLDLVVSPSLALLQVTFTELPSKLLCGEVRKFSMTLKNNGTCPLHRVRLTTNYPQSFTLDTNDPTLTLQDSEDAVYPSRSYAAKSSHVFVDKLRLNDVIDIPAVLEPKQTHTVNMWIHAPFIAMSHDVCFLLCYESVSHEPHVNQRHRVLRREFTITTHDSLSLRTIAQRAHHCSIEGSQLTTCLVSCEVDNITQMDDFPVASLDVLQLSSASNDWAISLLGNHGNTQTKICHKETALFCFKAVKCRNTTDHGNSLPVVFSDIVFAPLQIDSSSCPCADFYFRSISQGSQNKEITENSFAELSSATEMDLTVIVLWKASVLDDKSSHPRILMGQHFTHLPTIDTVYSTSKTFKPLPELPPVKLIRDLDPITDVRPPTEVTTRLVHYALRHASHVTHDFTKSRLCRLPVSLIIQNCSDVAVRVLVDTSKRLQSDAPLNAFTSTSYPPLHADLDFFWSGQTIIEREISARDSTEVRLVAAFPKAGVINLHRLAVFVSYKQNNTEMVLQRPVAISIVTIVQSIIDAKS